jgi:hypothetical protein
VAIVAYRAASGEDLRKRTRKKDGRLRAGGITRDLGVCWIKPFRLDISAAAKSGTNDLEIDIVNLWPNRLIGNAHLPPEKWFCKTNVRKFTRDHPLLPSGLLGPVLVESAG